MSDLPPERQLIPGASNAQGKNQIPYGLTRGQYIAAICGVILLFFVAFGVAMTMQGNY